MRVVWVLAVWVCAIFSRPLPPRHLKTMSRCSYWTGSPVCHNLHHRLNELNVHSQAAGVYGTCTRRRRRRALPRFESNSVKVFRKEPCKICTVGGFPPRGLHCVQSLTRNVHVAASSPTDSANIPAQTFTGQRARVVIRPKVLRASKCGAEPRSGAAASKNRNRFPSLIGDKL